MIIGIRDGEFVDEYGRILNLRGSYVTFVDRPFPIIEADAHFARLRACGLTLIRFVITWEAIEHAGPGVYDVAYLAYVREVLERARDHGMSVYVDPHQDVWSRWTGGDGAPLWTLEIAGFDVANFAHCDAAICRETYGMGRGKSGGSGTEDYPKMIWPTNYFKLACATMFTLFWAGERFAPQFLVADDDDIDIAASGRGINIQRYLQTRYINAMAELLKCLIGLDNIVGIGTMNEPSFGYINVADLSKGFVQSVPSSSSSSSSSSAGIELRYGLQPTPFQGMCLGEGYRQIVGEWSNGIMQHVFGRPNRWVDVDPRGRRAWKYVEGKDDDDCDASIRRESNNVVGNRGGCIWRQAGVWRINPDNSEPELLRPDYFADVDFGSECYLPFAREYAEALRGVWGAKSKETAKLLIFVELPPLEFSSTPFPRIPSSSLPDAVNATHWYDGVTLFTQTWKSYFSVDVRTHRPLFGYKNIFRSHVGQLADIKRLGVDRMDNSPTLIGECGIPFNMNGGLSYRKASGPTKSDIIPTSDSFGPQLAAMDHTLRCLEENLLSFTLWCYTSDNTNNEGDLWNREDLSIYSDEQKRGLDASDPHFVYDGLRAARAFVRPYARCIAGKPLVNKFDLKTSVFIYRGIDVGEKKFDVPTEIFIPKLWCSIETDMRISVSGGRVEIEGHDYYFIVKYFHSGTVVEHWIEIQGPKVDIPQDLFAWC
ncbi:hypothetical protein ACHAXA_000861 [Cyclostephanos tholiformis]|uniref:Uncharacterized protein n=1 Tax=Cyclostephanos tholiformis TaxID=382380 RepID=A0ABD3SRJ4_9STRA